MLSETHVGQGNGSRKTDFGKFIFRRIMILFAPKRYTRDLSARVVKLVDAGDSKSPAARRAGSIPAPGTRQPAFARLSDHTIQIMLSLLGALYCFTALLFAIRVLRLDQVRLSSKGESS